MTTLTEPKPEYLLDHDWEDEPRRLRLLEEHADPTTIRRLDAAGLGSGHRCLEVGAGRGSIAHWMSKKVGPTGHVTALDLETSLLSWLNESNLDVVAGDVLEIDFPEGSLDLVHARLVLMHIPERRRALERIVSWLRPGGRVVLEELDWMVMQAEPDPERLALFRAFNEALTTIDFECGRTLLNELHEAGLVETSGDVRVDVVEGESPLAQWEQLSIRAVSPQALEAGTATAEQIDRHLARLEDPGYRGLGWAWVGASGRRRTRQRVNGSANGSISETYPFEWTPEGAIRPGWIDHPSLFG
jgi:SAM-dependent methyltransferase